MVICAQRVHCTSPSVYAVIAKQCPAARWTMQTPTPKSHPQACSCSTIGLHRQAWKIYDAIFTKRLHVWTTTWRTYVTVSLCVGVLLPLTFRPPLFRIGSWTACCLRDLSITCRFGNWRMTSQPTGHCRQNESQYARRPKTKHSSRGCSWWCGGFMFFNRTPHPQQLDDTKHKAT